MLAKVDFLVGESQRFGLVGEYSRATNEIDDLSRVGGLGYLTRRADVDHDRHRSCDWQSGHSVGSKANPNLEAEESLNTEFGYRWQTDRHQLGISAYRDKYTNFVDSASFIRNSGTEYETCSRGSRTISVGNEYLMAANVGEVTVKGVEIEGHWLIGQQSLRRRRHDHALR